MAHAPGDGTQRRRAHGHKTKTPDPFVSPLRLFSNLLRGGASTVIDVWWEENASVSLPAGVTRGDFNMRLRHLPTPTQTGKRTRRRRAPGRIT
jgi:hypothetical protein